MSHDEEKTVYSPLGFCGHIMISVSTFYSWRDNHDEFREACEIAKVVRVYGAETLLIEADTPLMMAKAQVMLRAYGKQIWDSTNYVRHVEPGSFEIFELEPLI